MPDAIVVPDLVATGSLTANGNVAVVCASYNSVSIQLTGTWGGIVSFEGSPDGANWYAVVALDPGTGVAQSSSPVNGYWVVNCGGFAQIRARIAWSSGTAVISLNASFGQAMQNIVIQKLPPATSTNGFISNLVLVNQFSSVVTNGCATAIFQISGTWVGTLQFQGTGQDGTTFAPIPAVRLDTNPTFGRDVQYTTTVNGTFVVNCSGMTSVICKFTAYTSGTAVVGAEAGVGPGPVYGLPANRGRNLKCIGYASTFRIIGNNASPHNLIALLNSSPTAVLVALRELMVSIDSTAAQTGLVWARVSKPASAPTGGTSLTKVLSDSSLSSDANVTVLSGASADGTDATITATAGTTLWETFLGRPNTLVGWFPPQAVSVLPPSNAIDPIVLRSGEFVVVQALYTAGANNVTTIHYLASVMWDEFVYG